MILFYLKVKVADIKFLFLKSNDIIDDCFKLIELYQPLNVFPIFCFEKLIKEYLQDKYNEDRITEEEKQLYKDIFGSICESYGMSKTPYMKDEPEEAEYFKRLLRLTFGQGESILKNDVF